MPHTLFNMNNVHSSWQACVKQGLARIDPTYLQHLAQSKNWLPGPEQIFNAFSLPMNKVNYVLFGESPYPRKESANGFAFWDAAVNELWSPTGLSKKVNRATSLRNILKMLLIADDRLKMNHTSQDDIAKLDKQALVQTNEALFTNFINHGFLLLNATPVLQDGPPQKDAKAWHPFIQQILACLVEERPQVKFLLFGRIASLIDQFLPSANLNKFSAEHPYNISFITNKDVIAYFKPLHLLRETKSI